MTKPAQSTTPLMTLDQLADAIPKADPHLRVSIVEEHTREYFVAQGRQIASGRIVLDDQSLLNEAYQFWQVATPAQKETLVGFTPALLSIAVDEARKLAGMASDDTAKRQQVSAASAAQTAAAASAYARASALRNQAVTVLKKVAAHADTWTSRIEAAHANADVVTALGELAATGAAILAEKQSAIHSRAALHGLTSAYLDRLRAAAKDASAAASTHVGRRRSVSQGALDLEDGINLHILGAIIDAFDAAHDVDSTIPRLQPISTRHILGAHHAGRTTTAAGPTAPAAGQPSPAAGPTTPGAGPTTT
ncbi:MAG TPA: hypothetical protein VN613_00985 [Gemmatimonadaceae bacterium]|nr:hypothetical protein [Gemmatimonadaceae bacterium]